MARSTSIILTVVTLGLLAAFGWFLGLRRPPSPAEEIPLASSAARLASVPSVSTLAPNVMLTILPPTPTRPPTPTPQAVTVHVNGAVSRPGVYTLPLGSRVIDALSMAGGMLTTADSDVVNQAAVVRDGQQVYVPTRGAAVPQGLVPAGQASPVGRGTPAPAAPSGPINLNLASREELDTLPGIGPALADRIIEYRQKVGPFQRPEDLKKVSGIGDKVFENLKDRITAP